LIEEEGTDGGQDQDGAPDYDRKIKAAMCGPTVEVE
jgi:hypothetical protein